MSQIDLDPNGQPNGVASYRDEKGRWLTSPPKANRFKPGESGNPSGLGGQYHDAMKLARTRSVQGVKRMIELAELDNVDETGELAKLSRHTDARIAAHCVEWLWNVAWGKTGQGPLALDESPGVTIEQRRDEAMAILQAAFERVIVASKAQEEQPQAVDVAEPSDQGQARDSDATIINADS